MVLLTREQLEDRLAALHQVSLELVGDLSLDKVLERIVQMAREQAGARYAALGVLDEKGQLARFIPVGMSPDEIALMIHPPQGLGLLGLFRIERRTIRIPDISNDPRSVGFPPYHPRMQSFLGVPVVSGDLALGQIYLTEKIDYFEFTDMDERVIETLAAYAAIAITNARLYQDVVERDQILTHQNEDLALLNELAASLTNMMDVDEILDRTLTCMINHMRIKAGEIFLREEGEKGLRMALHRGDQPDPFSNHSFYRFGQGFIGQAAESGKPMISQDPRNDLRYLRPEVIEAGYRCFSFIPMLAHGSVVGVMTAATQGECEISERELNLLMAIGSWAAITIENVRLLNQARRLAVLEERERIGMDLHDGIIQSIYGVGLSLEYARMELDDNPQNARQKIEQSIAALNSTIHDIRSYILDLRPREFQGQDLRQGLKRLVDEFVANSSVRASLIASEDGMVDFPAMHALALFHICQEALANIAKHSKARQATINLWLVRDRVMLEVTDDGQGFDLNKMSVTLGHGLSNMHIRARKVGGDVEITSYPGEGTTVLAWVPRHMI